MNKRFYTLIFFVIFLCDANFSQTLSLVHSNSICANSSFTCQANYTGPAANAYVWSASSGITIVATSSVATLSGSACGQASITCVVLDASNFTLASVTSTFLNVCSTITISPSAQILCGPSQITLTASGASTYSWSTGATSAIIMDSPSSHTVYTVFGLGALCPATLSITVYNLLTQSTATSACANSQVTLTVAGANTFNWFEPPGNFMLGGTSAQVVTSPSVFPSTYTVYGFFPNCVLSRTVGIIAFPYLPKAVAPSSVCPASNFTLLGLNASSYTWTSISQTLQTAVYTGSQTSISNYTLAADSATCRGTHVFQIGMHPQPTLSISSPAGTICTNQNTQLYVSGAINYTWTNSPGMLSSLFGSSVIVSPTATTIYSVVGTNAQSCKASKTFTVLFGFYPITSIYNPISAVCAGYQTTVSASGAGSFFWQGSTFSGIINSTSVSISAGNYTVKGSNGGLCNDSLQFSIGLLPSIPINLQVSSDSTCLDVFGNVIPVFLNASGAPSYSWSPYLGGIMSNSVGPSIVVSPTVSTCFTLTGYNNTCNGTKTICISYSKLCTGIEREIAQEGISVFPIPCTHILSVNNLPLQLLHIKVIDALGACVLDYHTKEMKNVEINLSEFTSGIYYLMIAHSDFSFQKKIIKQ